MKLQEIKEKLKSDEYSFLREDRHLGSNICLLPFGGSHAYGTDVVDSDIDLRGIALNSKREILTNVNFEQFTNTATDTTIYAFNKMISLLINMNPNTIEIFGCKPEHYLYISKIGQELLDNKKMFFSKKCIYSFGGYANSQLRRLDNKVVRTLGQKEREQHILNSILNAEHSFKDKYAPYGDGQIRLYLGAAIQEGFEQEIFMDINLDHYPLRDYLGMWAEMNNIVKGYAKIGKRNKHAIEHDKLGKHMAHLVRLYFMCFDLLEKGEIVTYREAKHDLLMDIRNGKFLIDKGNKDMEVLPEFYDFVNDLENRLKYDAENTSLPDKPDYEAINDFVASVNERIVRGEC